MSKIKAQTDQKVRVIEICGMASFSSQIAPGCTFDGTLCVFQKQKSCQEQHKIHTSVPNQPQNKPNG